MAKKLCAACGKNLRRALKFAINPSARHPNANVNVIVDGKKTSACTMRKYRKIDAEYRRAWAGNLGYWAQYREDHPDYADRNRQLQRQRNAKTRKLKSGIPHQDEPRIHFAIRSISAHSHRLRRSCKR
jgi:hypothetical protein